MRTASVETLLVEVNLWFCSMTARIDFLPGQSSMADEGKVLFCLFGIGSGGAWCEGRTGWTGARGDLLGGGGVGDREDDPGIEDEGSCCCLV